MAKGFSLHVGINEVNSSAYTAYYPKLKNAENDAQYYQQLAAHRQFDAESLIGPQATSKGLVSRLQKLALHMQPLDLLFFTYSGHGTQVQDINGDEPDGLDECFVLYDRLLLDDELQKCWTLFREKVRIFMISDSCFNGTVSRLLLQLNENKKAAIPLCRGVDSEVARSDFEAKLDFFKSVPVTSRSEVKCSILHIASCGDNQLADDGRGGNGLFTGNLRSVIDQNTGSTYKEIFDNVSRSMPKSQTPYWDVLSEANASIFLNSIFLSI